MSRPCSPSMDSKNPCARVKPFFNESASHKGEWQDPCIHVWQDLHSFTNVRLFTPPTRTQASMQKPLLELMPTLRPQQRIGLTRKALKSHPQRIKNPRTALVVPHCILGSFRLPALSNKQRTPTCAFHLAVRRLGGLRIFGGIPNVCIKRIARGIC